MSDSKGNQRSGGANIHAQDSGFFALRRFKAKCMSFICVIQWHFINSRLAFVCLGSSTECNHCLYFFFGFVFPFSSRYDDDP